MKPSLLAEIRDSLAFIFGAISLYLTWRRRSPRESRDVTIHVPAAVARAVAPPPNLMLEMPAGERAVLDSMAEVFPYEFPPN